MGISTYCIIWSLWLARYHKTPRGIIYWLPADADVADFAKTKIDPMIEQNSIPHTLAAARKIKDSQGFKFIYDTPFYLRGLKSKTGVKSISADAAIYDEFDEADQSQIKQARERLSASDIKLERELSVPTIPDYGINKSFQETDQCYYAFKCTHCSTWNILEEEFPNCFLQDITGSYFHACKKCRQKLDVYTKGTWVQKYPYNKIRGYHISQLFSPFKTPDEIMNDYHTTQFMQHFYNHVLGMPYISASDRITQEMIFALCDGLRTMPSLTNDACSMGVDVGKNLHVCIVTNAPNKKLMYLGEVKNFEELAVLMIKYNVKNVVIDALPETRKVREFIAKHKGKAWMCFYNDNQKGSYAWNEEERMVQVNRTESLDNTSEIVINRKISFFQRNNLIEEFALHCSNLVKIVDEDEETGERKYVYKKLGPDHYRHAFNYSLIAASRNKSSIISVMR